MPIEKRQGCIGCVTCVETCPTDVIRKDPKTKKAFIAYPTDLQICHFCRMIAAFRQQGRSSGIAIPEWIANMYEAS